MTSPAEDNFSNDSSAIASSSVAMRVKHPEVIKIHMRRMTVVLIGVLTLLVLNYEIIFGVLQSNLLLNGLIAGAFLVGVFLCFRNYHRLKVDFQAMRDMDYLLFEARDYQGLMNYDRKVYLTTELVFSLKKNVQSNDKGEIVNSILPISVARSLFNIINNGVAERRNMMSYFSNLLLYLGLLGTFVGLFTTVTSINGLIGYLASGMSGEEDLAKMLIVLIQQLEEPLSGMGVAFGTSLAGLFSSVVLGSLAMNVHKAGMMFSNTYSNWLFEFVIALDVKDEQKIEGANNQVVQGAPAEFHQYGAVIAESLSRPLEKLIENGKEQLAMMESAASGQIEQLKAIHASLDQPNLLPALESLHTQGEELVRMVTGMVAELQEQQSLLLKQLDHQMSDSSRAIEHRKALLDLQQQSQTLISENHKTVDSQLGAILNNMQMLSNVVDSSGHEAFAQRQELIALQTQSHALTEKGTASFQALTKELQGLPDTLGTMTADQIKESAEALEQSLSQKCLALFKRYIQLLARVVRRNNQKNVEKVVDAVNTSQYEITHKTQMQVEAIQKQNGNIALKLFRTLHKMYRLLVRKGK